MARPHVVVISYPAQGHVAPLMKLSLKIAAHDVRVTFVNTESIHKKIRVSMPEKDREEGLISLVSIPDGLEQEDRNDVFKLAESIGRVMPGDLEDLILKLNRSNVDEQIKCVIAETSVGWALQVAKKMGIRARFGLLEQLAWPCLYIFHGLLRIKF
ncbi:UDP-glucuronosyl/UDP-glucosyltransferase [Corchorus olitorius]|uniref:UDP-glucuronosyl/UDP-glucosyltransferase n=1 Tax=Corchorus olitorius TaxID=93759 RepID=A0A1R3GXC5_9ROSI|nr:UDP-glucuronosyl/UDP-glucosyltransferase [Corchorus olitorius]